MKIAFLGLGIMGSRMATNLLKAGFTLHVYNRTPEKAAALVQAGASLAGSPAEAVRECEVVITMLDRPETVERIAFGDQGFVEAVRPGTLWMECSTVNPSFSRRMADQALAKGLRFLDTPVAGSRIPAEKGELVFFAGGETQNVDQARPLMEAMGKEILHLGGTGMGAAYKMVYNLLIGAANLAFAEALVLGESLGFSRQFLTDRLLASPVVAPAVAAKRSKIEQGDYEAEFSIRLQRKDLQLIAQTAYEQGVPLPGGNMVKEVLAMAEQAGWGELDYSALSDFLKNPRDGS